MSQKRKITDLRTQIKKLKAESDELIRGSSGMPLVAKAFKLWDEKLTNVGTEAGKYYLYLFNTSYRYPNYLNQGYVDELSVYAVTPKLYFDQCGHGRPKLLARSDDIESLLPPSEAADIAYMFGIQYGIFQKPVKIDDEHWLPRGPTDDVLRLPVKLFDPMEAEMKGHASHINLFNFKPGYNPYEPLREGVPVSGSDIRPLLISNRRKVYEKEMSDLDEEIEKLTSLRARLKENKKLVEDIYLATSFDSSDDSNK